MNTRAIRIVKEKSRRDIEVWYGTYILITANRQNSTEEYLIYTTFYGADLIGEEHEGVGVLVNTYEEAEQAIESYIVTLELLKGETL